MNCAHIRQVLDAYLDRELDAATSDEITQHLPGCPACTAVLAERDALRTLVHTHAPRHAAPEALRAHIAAFEGRGSHTPRRATGLIRGRAAGRRPSWWTASALATAAATLGLAAGLWLGLPATDDSLREHVVASHVASLTDAHRLMEVAASDQHVIKPWFQGKIDFAPKVEDYAAEGFTLAGARLDHVAERQAAALVYRIRNHVINVFVWRAANGASAAQAPAFTTARGYGVVSWTSGGLRYTAISDVEPRDLRRLADLMARAP